MQRISFTNTQVASSETARDINRGVLLNLIRRRQPISRADLARVSGLQRSTVSLITEQLIREKWVVNGPVGRLPRGRRPTFLRLNERRAIVVADLRPERTTVAVADVNGQFLSQETMATLKHPAKMVASLAGSMKHQMQSHPDLLFEGIGISLPGRIDERTGRFVFAPNLSWPAFDLKGPIEAATGMRVEMENAANAYVLAEAWFGAAEIAGDMVVVSVAEGVGTGIFVNHQIVRGRSGMAGEFGHVPLDPNGPPCACGGRGCWEVFASQRAALRYYHEFTGKQDGVGFQDLMTLAEAEDALALKAIEKMAHAVGKGMRMLIAGLEPAEIVVVGEFTRLWSRVGPVIEAEVAKAVLAGKPPLVRPATDPRMARLRGTVALVLQKHFVAATGTKEKRVGKRITASGRA